MIATDVGVAATKAVRRGRAGGRAAWHMCVGRGVRVHTVQRLRLACPAESELRDEREESRDTVRPPSRKGK